MKTSSYLRLPFFILIFAAGCASKKTPQVAGIEKLADSLFNVHVDSAHIAGASVLVAQHGEILLDKSYGFASLELSASMPLHASFEIGSVTKQFTATAILKLMEEGKLSLEDDITKYIDFDTQRRTVTINQLLNHTSGIASYTEIPDFWPLSIHTFERDTLLSIVELNGYLFEPGELLIYNNTGYFLLGLIIEKASGKTYEEYLTEEIFDPLEMNNTYYCSTSKVVKNKTYGYGFSPEGLRQKAYLDHTWPYAGGSLCSTTEDLYKWLKAIHEDNFLSEELYRLLILPDKLNNGAELRYAKGLTNYIDYGHGRIGHGGGIHGFLSDTRYYPDDNLYVICLVNTNGPNGAGFFAEQLTWKLLDKVEYESVPMENISDSIIGTYSGQVRGTMFTIKIGLLPDAITESYGINGEENIDTLDTYIGNNTWVQGNTFVKFEDNKLIMDQVSGYYILNKELD